MYKVLVADDEPMAVTYLKKLIELKCPDFVVTGTAENGQEIMEILKKKDVDVVVSDIQMPQMDGIQLVRLLRKDYPHIHSVIVSGYQDFEYVKEALHADVEDYLLKPVNPEEMRNLFVKIRHKLDQNYYKMRNHFFHKLGQSKDTITEKELKKLFPAEAYYGAIIRRNGVISRFESHNRQEIFSFENEQMIIYGRDNQEMLYLYPKNLVTDDIMEVMKHEMCKLEDETVYLTMVVCDKLFERKYIPQVAVSLYQTLDNSIIIGMNQIIVLGEKDEEKEGKSDLQFHRILHFIDNKEFSYVPGEMDKLFCIWEKEKRPQIWMEGKVRYLLYEMEAAGFLKHFDEYWLEDAFSEALSMKELSENVEEILRQYGTTDLKEPREEKESVFLEILVYMKQHLKDKLTIQTVCQEIGVSKTSLQRLFREYAGMSYNSYLTKLRIDEAKQMMVEKPESYIKNIAESVGFRDQFYFSRVFRSMVGMRPSEYLEEKIKLKNEQQR